MNIDTLEISTVKIKVDDSDIKTVDIDGRKDIFTHPEVKRLVNRKSGKLVQIGGVFYYKNKFFEFQAGISKEYGRLKVRKQGKAVGETELAEEAYDFLYDIYKRHFLDP